MADEHSRDQMRAADTDRERVAERLRAAHAEGRLDLAEYDQRVQHAWAARTYGELEVLTADLPRAAPARPPVVRRERRRSRRNRSRRGAVQAWAALSVINLVIWAIVSLTTMHWVYPWWFWVVGPWGVMLLMSRGSRCGEASRSLE